MSSTGQPASTGSLPPRGGVPRWAWEVMALLVVVAIAAVVVAVVAVRKDGTVAAAPTPTSTSEISTAAPTPTAVPSTETSPVLADGCLGGPTELDQAVVKAQRESPLTEVGAASFTASLTRWALATPPPPFQQRNARRILAPKATAAAKQWLSGTRDVKGSTGTVDFAAGKYYVEAFEGRTAAVTFLAAGQGTIDGVPQPDVRLSATVHLRAVNGGWRLEDKTSVRAIPDMERIGVAYTGGC